MATCYRNLSACHKCKTCAIYRLKSTIELHGEEVGQGYTVTRTLLLLAQLLALEASPVKVDAVEQLEV